MREVDRSELALEDGILQVHAEIAHGVVNLAQAFGVADVVGDEVGVSHGEPVRVESAGCLHAVKCGIEVSDERIGYGVVTSSSRN